MKEKVKYYIKISDKKEFVVSKQEFIKFEHNAGFRSKFGENELATGGFTSGTLSGRVIYENE